MLLLAILPAISAAEPGRLQLDEVLASSARHVPEILEGLQKVQQAQGAVLEAKGAFDTIVSSEGFDRATGYWDGQVLESRISQNVRPFGATLFGGYRISEGRFPIYEDEFFTNTGGEAKVGAVFSILRDRAIDARRFGEYGAFIERQIAELELLLTKLRVQQRSAIAYWRWVAAGHQLTVYKNLLDLAEKRQVALEKQVRSGAFAEILLTENMQNLTRRQSLVAQGRQALQEAANALSFFYRGHEGRPITPAPEKLPDMQTLAQTAPVPASIEDAEALIRQRPEFQILRSQIDRQLKKLSLDQNQLLPEFDMRIELAQDFGAIAEGGRSREDTDTIIGVKLSQPLQNRAARGRVNQTKAELKALEYRQRQLEDQLNIALRDIQIALDTARELVGIALQESEQSRKMRLAEREKFQQGDSDFFLLNRREEAEADALIRLIKARRELHIAAINYHTAALHLEQLGLE